MRSLSLVPDGRGPLRLLCLGAHADDIEIGCGGTVLRLLAEYPGAIVRWVVFSGSGVRRDEACRGAELFLRDSGDCRITVLGFPDSFFPFHGADIKNAFELLKREFEPSLVLTHWRGDAHQDHRLVAELTHNTFRDHLILEYEIPKYDGDFGRPNLFAPLTRACAAHKVEAILEIYASQRHRAWFDRETFMAVARLRGIGCNAPEGLAEAFYSTKLVI